jgi:multiple sugar transport system permease protein
MSAPTRPTGIGRLFEPARIGAMSIGGKVIVYALLLLWSLFVLFPLYWVVVTSLKLPIDVNAGPVYIPWVDFEPNLHAWRDLTVTGLGETIKPYLNSIIVGFASTALCMLIGSMAAYALARITYKPKFGTILLFVAATAGMAVAVGVWGIDWRIAAAIAGAMFVLLARALSRRFVRTRHPPRPGRAATPGGRTPARVPAPRWRGCGSDRRGRKPGGHGSARACAWPRS